MSGYFLIRGSDPKGTDRIEVTGEMVVGRSEDCDLRVQDGHPSRRHARLTVDAEGLWLEDLGSANGTLVNDRLIETPTLLHNGDRVAFDLSAFVVEAPSAARDNDATVVRRVEPEVDPNATVVRPAPAEPKDEPKEQPAGKAAEPESAEPEAAKPEAAKPEAAEPARPEPEPAPEPSKPAAVPRSWADPEYQPEGTRVLSPEELKAMAAGTPADAGDGPAVSGPQLRVVNGNSAGKVLSFAGGDQEWSIGTEDARDLQLDDDGISAFHAKISADKGRWRIIDQMSANGTFVNGDKATVSYLKDGDRIRFAQVECEFRLPSGKARKAAPAGRPKPAGGNRTWLIIAAAAAVTVAALGLLTWLG
ncbi:MAG: FHA domain-containing protein [Gammaproteobacteria bacterium]|nr:FHA domain-containing protein [Gammaproteobacteria bacterium]